MNRILAFIVMLAAAAAGAERRTAARSEPRDQAHAQRGRMATTQRSSAARREFRALTRVPRPGNSRVPAPATPSITSSRKRGGLDASSNMQWQTIAEGKAKDRVQ